MDNSNKEIFLIKHANDAFCTLKDVKGEIHSPCLPPTEDDYHLWTIQDAKDGDVLAAKSGNRIFLYSGNCDLRHRPCAYCGTYKGFSEILFSKCAIGNYFTDEDVYPATKKQRDLLFQKMKESGYEWDAEKKELKEIEQKPAFDAEIPFGAKDSELMEATYFIPKGFHAEIIGDEVRIKKGEQNPAWGEEDEKEYRRVGYAIMKVFGGDAYLIGWIRKFKNKLLHQTTWKPSEEQMKVLDVAIKNSHLTTAEYDGLVKLREQLKKL